MIKENPIAMRDALIEKIWREMKKDKNIFFVSADFGSPVLDKVRQDFPDQFVNVGVAEQNLINISVSEEVFNFDLLKNFVFNSI